jgi:outer membrane protein OmpA-like peptidoglycan-associated protein
MLGARVTVGRRSRDDGEKPFWISFSDLMTALMVLFLVVMAVSLLSVTQELRNVQQDEKDRQAAIDRIMDGLAQMALPYKDVSVSRERLTISFGEAARFSSGDYRFPAQAATLLRTFVPEMLKASDSEDGRRWFKRVVVEGFTDNDGSYLFNLDLSLKRAQSVVCALLDSSQGAMDTLSDEQKYRVRELFLVGGFSSNSAKASKEESRRVELRLDFRTLGESETLPPPSVGDLGRCQLR